MSNWDYEHGRQVSASGTQKKIIFGVDSDDMIVDPSSFTLDADGFTIKQSNWVDCTISHAETEGQFIVTTKAVVGTFSVTGELVDDDITNGKMVGIYAKLFGRKDGGAEEEICNVILGDPDWETVDGAYTLRFMNAVKKDFLIGLDIEAGTHRTSMKDLQETIAERDYDEASIYVYFNMQNIGSGYVQDATIDIVFSGLTVETVDYAAHDVEILQ